MQAAERRREARGKAIFKGHGNSPVECWDQQEEMGGSSRGKGNGCGSHGCSSFSSPPSSRKKPYVLLFLISFGAAFLSGEVVHKLREKRVIEILLGEREDQIVLQKTELTHRLTKAEDIISYLKERQKDMELALEVRALKERLKAKEQIIEEMEKMQNVTAKFDNATALVGTEATSGEAIPSKGDDKESGDEYGPAKDGNFSTHQPSSNGAITSGNQIEDTTQHVQLLQGGEEGAAIQDPEGDKPPNGEWSSNREKESHDKILDHQGLQNTNGIQTTPAHATELA